jgi:tripartite-type tricarboxylate transporter receptor subunit TctC
VDGYISSISDPLAAVKGGNARILGVADTQRSPILPDVKTYKEQGYDVTGYLSTGVIAPAGTPRDVLAAISAAAKKAMATDEYKKKLLEVGKESRFQDTAEFEKFWDDLEAETAKLMPLAKAGAK